MLLQNWKNYLNLSELSIRVLVGGLNNTNLILTSHSRHWVLKIRPDNYKAFGADASASIDTQKACSTVGIGAEVICCDSFQEDFLSEFLQGVTLSPDYYRENDLFQNVIDTLRILHAIKIELPERSFFDDIRLFMVGANRRSVIIPERFNRLLSRAYEIEQLFENIQLPKVCCHNDLVPQNFLLCQSQMYLVDFDYAGTGWIAADLASAISQFEMTEDEAEKFLKYYDNHLDDSQRGRIAALRYCNNIREIAFTLFAEPVLSASTNTGGGIDYSAHRDMNINQAEVALNDSTFSQKCAAVGQVRNNALF